MEAATKAKANAAGSVEKAVYTTASSNKWMYRFLKRLFDILVSLAAGLMLLIPMVIVAILIRLDSKGPAIFRQERMGKDGKVFTIYKFRTMSMDAPHELATREFTNSEEYMTKLSRILRRSSIDELPQLYNILRGDMSIVGYRPVCLTETELNDLRMRYGVFAARPGITGLAQVSGRDNIGYEEKALLDARYVAERSIKMDLWCLIQTVKVVISGEGVI